MGDSWVINLFRPAEETQAKGPGKTGVKIHGESQTFSRGKTTANN